LPPGIYPLPARFLRLKAGDGAARDFFGAAIAISSDAAIAGDPRNDILGGADQGAAYIFI
jgi:hypothetical protein